MSAFESGKATIKRSKSTLRNIKEYNASDKRKRKVNDLRKGHILVEMIVMLICMSMIFQLGYQILCHIHLDRQRVVQQVRQREMVDLTWRLKVIAPQIMQTRVAKTDMTFYNAKLRDECTLQLHRQRLIYRKHGEGYYVLCTQVENVTFERITDHLVQLMITFLDQTVGRMNIIVQS